MTQRNMSGNISDHTYKAFKTLQQELGVKSQGKLIERLLATYRNSREIIEAYFRGEIIPANPWTEEDYIKELLEASRTAPEIPIGNLSDDDLQAAIWEFNR